ncbi:MAG TPA: Gfo/Idh/MocA family oxidoreductase, partial [Candidatus Acidoferrum sp.]|nr:Gfo/Idh/MocA family oxidoreductase [Candidatus Acidoferrum sp.]
ERYHVPAIKGVPEVVRSIVVDADPERARAAAERFDFPRWSTDPAELAQHADLVAVLVPNGLHAEISCELLKQGVHVLCEKPMARNVDECSTMVEAARRGGAVLCVGHNRRFRQHVSMARQFLSRGLIGEVTSIFAEEGSASDWPRSAAYFDPVQSGGGALMDVGIHAIDMIRWLAGEFDRVEYKGDATGGKVESEAEMTFRMTNGATGQLVASRTRNLAQKITFNGRSGFLEVGLWETALRIRSAKGKAFQNFPHLDIAVPRRPPQDASFVEQLRNFVQAVRGEGELLVDGAEGMANVGVVCRAYFGETRRALSSAG